MTRLPSTSSSQPLALRDRMGICQWFHFQDYRTVRVAVERLAELGTRLLRTGISWADFHRPGGRAWYDWQMRVLADAGLEVLLSVWHTPPSISENGACNGPPRRLGDYADFIDTVISAYAGAFGQLELWNEPNNRYKWDFVQHDPEWRKFAEMVAAAGNWARHRRCTTVLGGMMPADHHWLQLMDQYGALQFMDIVALHGFPGMWWPGAPNWDWHEHWRGWDARLDLLRPCAGGRALWITETGLSTWDLATQRPAKHDLQQSMLLQAASAAGTAGAARLYWYSLIDLDPERPAIEGFHVDENEYHMGLIQHDGRGKPAFETFKSLMRQAPASDALLTH